MFDIDSGKLLIVAVLALIVIGPKDLPRVLRQLGQMVGKLRRMSAEFQGQFMDAIKDAELEDIRKELKDLEKASELNYNFDPARDIQAEVTGIKTEVETALQTVEADAVAVKSPAEGFALPAVPDSVMQEAEIEAGGELTTAAEGIAPASDAAILPDVVPAPAEVELVKRKLFVKPHRSRFVRLNSDRTAQLTGQAISVRQRVVRSKPPLVHDVVNS